MNNLWLALEGAWHVLLAGLLLGAGLLRILPRDFARQLTTFRADGRTPLRSLGRFGTHFARTLIDTYGPVRKEDR